MVVFLACVLFVGLQAMCKAQLNICEKNYLLRVPHEHYQPGDVIIGGLTSHLLAALDNEIFEEYLTIHQLLNLFVVPKNYQHLLALEFAVQEINTNPEILPNLTLGFHIYDSYYNVRMTYQASLGFPCTQHRFVPNYKCGNQKNLIAIIGGLDFETSLHMSVILGLYKIPQISYGSFIPEKIGQAQSSPFYRMVPNEAYQYNGIAQLLLHFRWTWVGFLAVDGESGDRFLQSMELLLSQRGICFAFTKRTPKTSYFEDYYDMQWKWAEIYLSIAESKANTVVVFGETKSMLCLRSLLAVGEMENKTSTPLGKVWIMTAQLEFTALTYQLSQSLQVFHGSISFSIHSSKVHGFKEFLELRNPFKRDDDGFLKQFWAQSFSCLFPSSVTDKGTQESCTGKEKLEDLPSSGFEMSMTGHSYSIYNAVYVVAHALHAMDLFQAKHGAPVKRRRHEIQPWQLQPFLRRASFNNSVGESVSFGENRELETRFDITNLIIFPNNSFMRVKVGKMETKAHLDKQFSIEVNKMAWHGNFKEVPPLSVCNKNCPPGTSMKKREGEKFCCYDCALCPQGKISLEKDMEKCDRCLEDYYPNVNQTHCLPKTVTFLSLREPLGIIFALFSLAFALLTGLVLAIFIKHQDTPVVRANNRDLTYTLLISLLFCFLCPFLFLIPPEKVTCLFQQIAFGIVFTVTISCVLAKSITVILAFVATNPGSIMSKLVGKRLTIAIVLSCTFIQVDICIMWLVISPPFPNLDKHSMMREIILECNEGSITMFYCVLVCLGFLALISFVMAFLGRKLPDSFNEAKFITFSMLIFCSVWISFIPVYLSTKGKYAVAVEIFSILGSSAGLLGLIFTPKCYIIVLRPTLNTREQLIKRKK